MTLSERRYYRFAVLLSIIFHTAILFIHFALPKGFYQNPTGLETMAPGLMDLSPGSPNTEPTLKETGPAAAQGIPRVEETVTVKTESPVEAKPEKVTQPEPVKTELKVDKPKEVTKKEKPKEVPHRENLVKNPAKTQPAPADNVAKTGDANSPNDKTGRENGLKTGERDKAPPAARNFGTGELMIAGSTDLPIYYPKKAQNEGTEGDVTVRLYVDADGRLEKAEVLHSSGNSLLDSNAVKYGERLKPKGVHDKYYIDYMVSYKLDQDAPAVKFIRSESRL
ncbi:MAG TPA: energy transducer TonB [Bacillota bacterium]|nr:energy transducer TonB [Bacillota bacterium]